MEILKKEIMELINKCNDSFALRFICEYLKRKVKK